MKALAEAGKRDVTRTTASATEVLAKSTYDHSVVNGTDTGRASLKFSRLLVCS